MSDLRKRFRPRDSPIVLDLSELPEQARRRHVVSHRIVERSQRIYAPQGGSSEPAEYSTDDRSVTILQGVSTYAKYGLVRLPGEIFLEDSMLKVRKKLRERKLARRWRQVTLDTPVFSLDVYSNYYHFWRECIVPMLLLREAEVLDLGDLTVTVTKPLAEWQKQAFRYLLPRRTQIRLVNAEAEIHAPITVLPSVHRSSAFSPRVVAGLRELVSRLTTGRVPRHSQPTGPTASTGLYISRRFASRRRPVNERPLIEALKARGASTVVLEDIDPRDALMMFGGARFIIARHGAGLTNIIGCPPSAGVLEIHSVASALAPNHYSALAASLGLAYSAIPGSAPSIDADVEMPLSTTLDWIDGLMARSEVGLDGP